MSPRVGAQVLDVPVRIYGHGGLRENGAGVEFRLHTVDGHTYFGLAVHYLPEERVGATIFGKGSGVGVDAPQARDSQ